jgi:hypothetical protein
MDGIHYEYLWKVGTVDSVKNLHPGITYGEEEDEC